MKKENVNITKGKLEFLTEPYSVEELKSSINEDGKITGTVMVDLREMFNMDFETFLDIISEELVGNVLLNGMSYRLVGCDDENNLYFEVTGTVEMPEDESEEEEEQQWTSVKVYCDCITCPSRINGVCTSDVISIDHEGRCADCLGY